MHSQVYNTLRTSRYSRLISACSRSTTAATFSRRSTFTYPLNSTNHTKTSRKDTHSGRNASEPREHWVLKNLCKRQVAINHCLRGRENTCNLKHFFIA